MELMTSTQNVNGYQTVCDFNRNLFLEALDSYHGAKVIVWEQTLMTPFSMVIGASKLKQRKVVAMYDLNDCGAVSSIEHNHVIYIISATFIALKKLIAHLHSILALHLEDTRLHHVLFVPDATLALRDRLEEHREINSMLASVEPLPIRIYTLYDDVFTLLMEHTPAKLLINNDWTELHKCACALRQLEQLSVSLPNIRCKGKWSAQITEIINKMRNDANENEDASKNDPKRINISDIIIIDRWVDPLTPMLMQHTYAGLIDEICNFGVSGNLTASFFPKKDGSEGDAASTTRSLRDEIFVKLRDLHISNIGKSIADTVTEIRTEKSALKEFSSIESMTERKVLVRKVVETDQKEFNVRIHTAIAEHLMNTIRDDPKMSKFLEIEMNIIRGVYGERVIPFVEDLILCAFQASCVLRFIALQCLTYGGLKPNTYTAYLRLFVQTYGAYETALWIKLQLMGLIYEKQPKIKCNYASFEFESTAKRLDCFVESMNNDRNKISSAYSGYVPILVRHIETGLSNNWSDWTTLSSPSLSTLSVSQRSSPNINSSSTVVMFIVGGVTFAEIACLRRIATKHNVIIVCTSITRGTQLIRSIRST